MCGGKEHRFRFAVHRLANIDIVSARGPNQLRLRWTSTGFAFISLLLCRASKQFLHVDSRLSSTLLPKLFIHAALPRVVAATSLAHHFLVGKVCAVTGCVARTRALACMTAGRVSKSRKKVRTAAQAVAPPMRRGTGQRGRDMRDAVNTLFNDFKDADQDKIGPESLEAFFEALELNPLDISALIFAWKLNAQTPCEFSRAEFVDGLMRLGVDSMAKLKKKVHALKSMIADPADFRAFYLFSFDYNKPPGQRTLPIDTARQLWPLLFGDRFQHLDLWLEFLEPRKHAVTRDSFVLLLDFANTINADLSNYDEEGGAWPVIIDEFVDYAKSKQPTPEVASDEDLDMSD